MDLEAKMPNLSDLYILLSLGRVLSATVGGSRTLGDLSRPRGTHDHPAIQGDHPYAGVQASDRLQSPRPYTCPPVTPPTKVGLTTSTLLAPAMLLAGVFLLS